MQMNSTPTLLGIFAHPDDESFGPGGTLARYARLGAHVHVIIATDGIAGSVEDGYERRHDSLAQARAEELADAAVALGVTSIWSLPYRDSGMPGVPENDHPQALLQQPLERLAAELRDYMLRLRPQVVVTHDPFGGYGHPDHVRCCEATTAAFHALLPATPSHANTLDSANGASNPPAASPSGPADAYWPQKLYYTAFDKRWLKVIVRLMPLFGQDPTALGRNRDINLVEISRWETPVHARIDVQAYLADKEAASRAHASQYGGGPSFLRILPKTLRQHFLGTETFTRAYPAPSRRPERDLFAGIMTV